MMLNEYKTPIHSTLTHLIHGDFNLMDTPSNVELKKDGVNMTDKINAYKLSEDYVKACFKAIQDEWWRTDPIGLMWVFSVTEWRFRCAAVLYRVAELIDIK